MLKNLAPIILFVYNRPQHTYNVLNSLKQNDLASESVLYIYSDAAKTKKQETEVIKVRQLLDQVKGFKRVELIKATSNRGLATSVVSGVTKILERHGKAIILEDDLVCANNFLIYMNKALEIYQDQKSIWSISGYAPFIKIPHDYKAQIYLSPRGCSWGWATWKDRWLKVDWEVSDYQELRNNEQKKKEFNKGGDDLFKLLELQMLGKVNSWAIRWCYAQFKAEKYTVYPIKSKVINKGFDYNGTHNKGKDSRWDVELSNDLILFPKRIELSMEVLNAFKKKYDLDFVGRIGYFLKKHGGHHIFFKLRKFIRN